LRLGKPGKGLRPEVGEMEQSADLPARRFADDQRARSGQGLQPASEVRGLADNPALLRSALADHATDKSALPWYSTPTSRSKTLIDPIGVLRRPIAKGAGPAGLGFGIEVDRLEAFALEIVQ
jgi:hypothetical protein